MIDVARGQVWESDGYVFTIVDIRASYAIWWEETCFPDAGCDHVGLFEDEYTLKVHQNGHELEDGYEYAESADPADGYWHVLTNLYRRQRPQRLAES